MRKINQHRISILSISVFIQIILLVSVAIAYSPPEILAEWGATSFSVAKHAWWNIQDGNVWIWLYYALPFTMAVTIVAAAIRIYAWKLQRKRRKREAAPDKKRHLFIRVPSNSSEAPVRIIDERTIVLRGSIPSEKLSDFIDQVVSCPGEAGLLKLAQRFGLRAPVR